MDFSMILFIALCVTGAIWAWDSLIAAPKRRRTSGAVFSTPSEGAAVSGPAFHAERKEPFLVEYSKAFFPVIVMVFLLRSFVVEPFRIPSGSMLPNLHIGDFILVNKFTYGIRLPILHTKVVDTEGPARGDVMVFRFPHDESVNFIKRVIGLPGDEITYRDKMLVINDKPIPQESLGGYVINEGGASRRTTMRRSEQLEVARHDILVDITKDGSRTMEFRVPEDHYFVMGDNRDYSNDSRYWGFVPESHIVGKAFFIWFSWDSNNGGGIDWSRIGNTID